jgi:hypothetical protein
MKAARAQERTVAYSYDISYKDKNTKMAILQSYIYITDNMSESASYLNDF